MTRPFLLISFFSIMSLSPLSQAYAQGHDMYCERADSTAAVQECLKRHLASAQKRLNTVYQKVSDQYEGEAVQELADIQRQWLAYRDAECTWEAEQSKTPALKRTNELSCMARVTDDRADILAAVLMDTDNPEQSREYGSFPRWMNVVAKEKGNVFWDYNNRMRGDLNCDGEDEHFIIGVTLDELKIEHNEKPQEADVEDIVPNASNFGAVVTLAVADYPAIGRPKAIYIDFPVLEGESAEALCDSSPSMKLEMAELETSAEGDEGNVEKEKLCGARLVLKGKKCEAKSVLWTGKTYAVEIKQEEIEETEDKNE